MKEQLISYKTAKLAKEKGFSNIKTILKDITREFVDSKGEGIGDYYSDKRYVKEEVEPTQALLQKWLREEHEIYVSASIHEDALFFKYNTRVPDRAFNEGSTRLMQYGFEFKTHEEALEKGLQEALKLIS